MPKFRKIYNYCWQQLPKILAPLQYFSKLHKADKFVRIPQNLLHCGVLNTGAQLGRGWDGEVSPTHFWKSKKVSWFWKKGPDCIHLYPVLRVSRRKNSKIFSCGAFSSRILDEMFIEVPKFLETSPSLKDFWLLAWNSSFLDNFQETIVMESF